MDTLAKVSQAIYQQRALQIQCHSLSSDLTSREIGPFPLVDHGLRWHVHAYDRKCKRFTDFVINASPKPSC